MTRPERLRREIGDSMTRRLALLFLAAALAAAPAARAQKLDTEEDKTIYALGLAVARNLKAFSLTPEEVKTMEAGLTAGLTGAKPAVELSQYESKLDPLVQSRTGARAKKEREQATAYIKGVAAEKGAKTTASGLVYRELKAGTGDSPTPKDKVTVNYVGKLRDGSVFDSTLERGKPAEFPLGRMIPCWMEGLQLMKPGGKAEITCPADLAYGDTGVPPGAGDRIPPGAALHFEVELLKVEKNAAMQEKMPDKPPLE
jgi:FKBP-type peptidyl-prolyl cis-trans isomerase FkpA